MKQPAPDAEAGRRPRGGAVRRGGTGAGFLLVEALTAMAIGALLLVGLGSLASLVLRASDRTSHGAQEIEESARIFAALVDRLQTITPQRWAGPEAGFVFEGTETGLFFARFHDGPERSRTSRLVILSGDGLALRQEERPLPPDAQNVSAVPALTGEATTAILQRGFAVRFAYFSRLADGTEVLTDRWSGRSAMPVAVRATLTDAEGTSRGSVRVPVRVDAEPGCAATEAVPCSLRPRADPGSASGDTDTTIDPDDARGWERYGRP